MTVTSMLPSLLQGTVDQIDRIIINYNRHIIHTNADQNNENDRPVGADVDINKMNEETIPSEQSAQRVSREEQQPSSSSFASSASASCTYQDVMFQTIVSLPTKLRSAAASASAVVPTTTLLPTSLFVSKKNKEFPTSAVTSHNHRLGILVKKPNMALPNRRNSKRTTSSSAGSRCSIGSSNSCCSSGYSKTKQKKARPFKGINAIPEQQQSAFFRRVITCNNNAVEALRHGNEDEAYTILRNALKQAWQLMDSKDNKEEEKENGQLKDSQKNPPNTISQTYLVKLPQLSSRSQSLSPSSSSSSSSSPSHYCAANSTVFNRAIQLHTKTSPCHPGRRRNDGDTMIPSSFTTNNEINSSKLETPNGVKMPASHTTNDDAITAKDIETCTSVIIFNFALSHHRKCKKVWEDIAEAECTLQGDAIDDVKKSSLQQGIEDEEHLFQQRRFYHSHLSVTEELYTMLLSYLDPTTSVLMGNIVKMVPQTTVMNGCKDEESNSVLQQRKTGEVAPIAVLLRLACVNNLLELKSTKRSQYDTKYADGTTAGTIVDDIVEFWSSHFSSESPALATSLFHYQSKCYNEATADSDDKVNTKEWIDRKDDHHLLNNLLHDPYSYESKLLNLLSAEADEESSLSVGICDKVTACAASICTNCDNKPNFVRENLAMIAAFTYMMKPFVHPLAPFVQLISNNKK